VDDRLCDQLSEWIIPIDSEIDQGVLIGFRHDLDLFRSERTVAGAGINLAAETRTLLLKADYPRAAENIQQQLPAFPLPRGPAQALPAPQKHLPGIADLLTLRPPIRGVRT
jgi:hypothetical protein